jgi:RNA-directed DNA polymerase
MSVILRTIYFLLNGSLKRGGYDHGPYKCFTIQDPKHRVIHKACVRDRLLHHALHRVLYPVFNRSFIFDSYSCRVGKGTHAAVMRLERFARTVSHNCRSKCFVLKFDVKSFFATVDHEILMAALSKKIVCERTRRLVQKVISSFQTHQSIGGVATWKPNVATVCECIS